MKGPHKFKLKKEDTVQIIAGKDKGKRGRILKIFRDKDRVVVELKKQGNAVTTRIGGGSSRWKLHYSNVLIICRKCGPTRIGYKLDTGNDSKVTKTRICRKCGEAL